MRFHRLLSSLLIAALAACMVTDAAFADESVEGQGFVIRVPDGFRKEMDQQTDMGGGSPFSPFSFGGFGGLGGNEMADMKVFLRGSRAEPTAAIVVMSGRADDADGVDLSDIEAAKREVQGSLGTDVEVVRTAVSGYDALEIMIDLAAIPDAAAADVEGSMWMLAVPADGFVVMVMYMNMEPDKQFEAQSEWQVLKLGLQVDPPMGWSDVMLWGLIGAGVCFVFSLGFKAFQGAGDDSYNQKLQQAARDWGYDEDPYAPGPPSSSPMEPAFGSPELRSSRPPAPAPSGLRSTFERRQAATAPTGSKPPPPPSKRNENAPPPKTSGGLRSTLPPSGTWSDGNR